MQVKYTWCTNLREEVNWRESLFSMASDQISQREADCKECDDILVTRTVHQCECCQIIWGSRRGRKVRKDGKRKKKEKEEESVKESKWASWTSWGEVKGKKKEKRGERRMVSRGKRSKIKSSGHLCFCESLKCIIQMGKEWHSKANQGTVIIVHTHARGADEEEKKKERERERANQDENKAARQRIDSLMTGCARMAKEITVRWMSEWERTTTCNLSTERFESALTPISES